MNTPAIITIALPVFNGEEFLKEAINSILAQTYSKWRLIICDNASTDSTREISEQYVSNDNRIEYLRHETNIGAGPNFNEVVKDVNTPYFKWLAHDDKIAPTFLSKCIEILENDEYVSIASSQVRFIDSDNQKLHDYKTPFKTADKNPVVRYCDMLKPHPCYEVFGVIRTEVLNQTNLIGNYKHGDGVLLAHLALQGKIIEIPECLLYSRKHDKQSMYLFGITREGVKHDLEGYAEWFDPKNKGGISFSFNRRLRDYFKMIVSSPIYFSQKLKCLWSTLGWSSRFWRIILGEWKRFLQSRIQQARK